jgi:hypothetical protein
MLNVNGLLNRRGTRNASTPIYLRFSGAKLGMKKHVICPISSAITLGYLSLLFSTPVFSTDFFTAEKFHMSEKNDVINSHFISWGTLIDIESDGDLDLIANSWNFFTVAHDPVYVMLNDGTGAFSFADEFITPMAATGAQHWPLVADFNQDGRDDLYVFGMGNEGDEASDTLWTGTYNQLFLQREGLGLVDSSDETLTDPRRNIAHSAATGDIDGDGDLDIFNAGLKFRTDLMQMNGWQGLGSHFLINQGGEGVFTPNTARLPDYFSAGLPDGVHNVQDAALVDIDRDGDVDLLITMPDGDVYPELFLPGEIPDPAFHILLNDGSGVFTRVGPGLAPALNPSEGHYPYNLSTADVNNDGWPDVFINVNKNGLNGGSIQLALNNGDGSFSDASQNMVLDTPWNPEDSGGFILRVFTDDFNNDAWPDILSLGAGSKPKLLINNGDGTFHEATSILGGFPDDDINMMDVGDIDGDGDIDIVAPVMCDRVEFCPGLEIMRNNEPYMAATPPALPGMPSLIAPANEAVDPGSNFSWQHVNGAQTYRIEISKNPAFLKFDGSDLGLDGLTGNSIDVSKLVDLAGFNGLQLNNRYYWRVAPVNYAGQGAWSETRSFDFGEVVEFTINAGLNDAWVNADAPFQGMFVTVFPSFELMFAAWFSFDSVAPPVDAIATLGAPDQRWVTALGPYSGTTAALKAEMTTGGKFNTSDPVPTQDTAYGTINMEFTGCNSANVHYDFPVPAESGSFVVSRVLTDNVGVCEGIVSGDIAVQSNAQIAQSLSEQIKGIKPDAESAAFMINSGLNDSWVNPDAAFQGMFLTVFPELQLMFAAWFTFDSVQPPDTATATFGGPDQRWLTALGSYSGTTANLNVEMTTGGQFNSATPTPTQDTNYGTLDIDFTDCNNAMVTFDFPSAGEAGNFSMNRVLDDNVGLCEVLSVQ